MCVCDTDDSKYREPIHVKRYIDWYTTDGCKLAPDQCTFVSSDRPVAMAIGGLFEEEADAPQESDSDVSEQMEYIDKESEDITPDLAHDEGDSSSDEEDSEEADEKLPPSPGNGPDGHEDVKPNTYIRDQFREYCAHATENFIPLSQDEIRCIHLLHVLKLKNAPLNSYEAIMRWHLIQAQKIRPHESLANYPHYIGRKTIIKKLIKRYNYENKLPYKKTVRLPVSGTTVRITCHSAQATIQCLLTDPRIKADATRKRFVVCLYVHLHAIPPQFRGS